MMPPAAEARFLAYVNLDGVKNRNARIIYKNYLTDNNRTEEADSVSAEWRAKFPEELAYDFAYAQYNSGNVTQTVLDTLYYAIEQNPIFWNAWVTLGSCYQVLNRNDTALKCLIIADGLNPYNHVIYNNMAHAYEALGDHANAERYWYKTIARDSMFLPAIIGLDLIEKRLGRARRPCDHLLTAANRPQASLEAIQALGDCYTGYQEFEKARKVYEVAIQHGLDSAYLKEMEKRVPQLQR
jgi:tetratricopeptide (TPR) repeat protein